VSWESSDPLGIPPTPRGFFVGTEGNTVFQNKRVVVVMPAYNAVATLRRTYDEIMAHGIVDRVIVVDDDSHDGTADLAKTLPNTRVHVHPKNRGYGANQKTCYRLALEEEPDIVIMVHPDYQYTPRLLPAMAALVANDLYACVLGSRILGGYARKGGMPLWRYVANRFLTLVENLLTGAKLSEYHTGYRAFSREILQRLPLEVDSDDFVFDNQMLLQVLWFGYGVGEITCPTRYAEDASSISFRRSVRYGFGCLKTALEFRLAKLRLASSDLFPKVVAAARLSTGEAGPV